MKKFLLGLGALASVAAPVAAVISCDEGDKTPEKSEDQTAVDKIKAIFADFTMQTSETYTAIPVGTVFEKSLMDSIGIVITPIGFTLPKGDDGVAITFELEEIKAEEKAYSGTITFIKNDVTETKTFTVTKIPQDNLNVNKAIAFLKKLTLMGKSDISKNEIPKDIKEGLPGGIKFFKSDRILTDYSDFGPAKITYTIPNDIAKPTKGEGSTEGSIIYEVKSGSITKKYESSFRLYELRHFMIRSLAASPMKRIDVSSMNSIIKINGKDNNDEVLPSSITNDMLYKMFITLIDKDFQPLLLKTDITIIAADDTEGTIIYKWGSSDIIEREFILFGFKSSN